MVLIGFCRTGSKNFSFAKDIQTAWLLSQMSQRGTRREQVAMSTLPFVVNSRAAYRLARGSAIKWLAHWVCDGIFVRHGRWE